MVTLDQVKLLESKVAKALDFVGQVSGENTLLKEKVDTYQKRINELELLLQNFREDQGRIEEGILNALDRLNQFEDAIQKSLSEGKGPAPAAAPSASPEPKKSREPSRTPEDAFMEALARPDDSFLANPRKEADNPTDLLEIETLEPVEEENGEPTPSQGTEPDSASKTAELDIF
jgi:chromosome segregation ATPase